MSAPRRIWIVAGEASGDARAAEVMRAVQLADSEVEFLGAGGPRMQPLAGTPFDNWTAEAAVLGLWDVLRHYGYFRKKFHGMRSAIRHLRPDAVLLVDYPGFNLRLAKALRRQGYQGKILYYISPQVWAWNRGRIPKMARLLDLMICVFPFEQPMYEASGLSTVFVGHPLLEALARDSTSPTRQDNLFAFFPGSREREVKRIFPVMVQAARLMHQHRPDVRFAAAAASEMHAVHMRQMADDLPMEVLHGKTHDLMQRAGAGLVCSGTATLEAAYFGLPYGLVYKIAWLTFEVGRRLVQVDALGIVNILNNYQQNPPPDPRLPARPAPHVVREFIQHDATPESLAAEGLRLLEDRVARETLSARLQSIVSTLRAEGASQRAARAILDALDKQPRPTPPAPY